MFNNYLTDCQYFKVLNNLSSNVKQTQNSICKIKIDCLQYFVNMRIIVRDVFQTYFPKYLGSYRKIMNGEHEAGKNGRVQEQQVKEEQQVNVPEVMSSRKSSTLSRGKKTHEALARNKSKQQKPNVQKATIYHDKYTTNPTTSQQQQKLSQLIPEKLTSQITQFIQSHRFYSPSSTTSTQQILSAIKNLLLQCIRSSNSQSQPHSLIKQPSRNPATTTTNASQQFINENLFKLSLYLNKETNKQIFTVYEYILMASPKSGISYETLSKRLKTDIINVSHYCCKLKKLRFIDWQHKKQGIIVFPKVTSKPTYTTEDHHHPTPITLHNIPTTNQQQPFSYSSSLLFNQLTLNENILVNLCSATSLNQGGLTNEQIKFKIMKHAENKMVRRTVEGMRYVEKNAQRQGKVFEFKYKKQTQRVIRQIDKKRADGINRLTQTCRHFLNTTFPTTIDTKPLYNQQLLQHIINTKLTDYISSIGIRQSRRQCTPLKLNRYIAILNYLEREGSETELDLRRHIIDVEKELEQYQGIVHKRSIIGILEGLKKVGLIYEVDEWFYPAWCKVERKEKPIVKKLAIDQYDDQDISHILAAGTTGTKRPKRDKQSKPNNHQPKFPIPPSQIRMISKKQHLNQIFTQLLSLTFHKALKRNLRKGFHRIMYAHRKKQTVQMFQSEKTIFHLLQSQSQTIQNWKQLPELTTTMESFMAQINDFVDTQGKRLEGFPQIEYEYVKYVRRNPNKMADNLRSKYGKGWKEKFQPLAKAGVIELAENGYHTLESFNGLLV